MPNHIVDAFRVKREAHRESRKTGDTFNPFAHIWVKRRNTSPAIVPGAANDDVDVEAGLGGGNREIEPIGVPVGHAMTAPAPSSASYNSRSRLNSDYNITASAQAPVGGVLTEGDEEGIPPNEKIGEASLGSSNTAAPEGLKNRSRGSDRPGSDGADEPDDSHKNDKDKKPKKEHAMFKNVQPKEPFTVANQLQRTFLNSYVNLLLLAAPVGIALHFTSVDPIAIFVVNFIAIIPLAAMLSSATEEIALRTGETLGGLLNATFGNAVELIVAIMALIKNEVVIVQTSLIGSILSNLLLVMGMCFFFGGLRRQEQYFNTTVAQTAASLLAMAVAGVIVPTVFDAASITSTKDVAMLSRGTAIILLVVYAAYLFFQLKTHQAVFSEESKKVPAKPFKHSIQKGAVKGAIIRSANVAKMNGIHESNEERQRVNDLIVNGPEDDDEGEEPQLHFFVALGVLAGSTVVIAFCAEFLVDSIDYVTTKGHISKEFLGLILLPIVGNAAEHATAVTVAVKDKMDLAIGVAVGSSMQVALFLIPLLVVIGWGMDLDDMSLSFDIFQVAVLFVSVLLVNYLIGDGKSHWLEGMLLMCLYCIIAVCSWWYPA
ncbi:Ca2+:H+ antiporter [Sporothrix brasiliensis 5110]|uniref:Ca2+:H+ antiporter n=1 Tax=Sporothrix brasiliensis 5110 TaxID=1398154 RepID=A0A0C2J3Q5_9PEZI|nr:Ca2+:H+ antiporter [Sporothrix brasiliensis 5110]KIH91692.1 Ca2+:H+ antiporter [Sporothrix brasiliensis 5110]